jgi:hypothetical protein
MIDIEQAFKLASDEHGKFDRIENPLARRPDLCAFLKLDQLVPDSGDIIAAAEHDEIYLDVGPSALAEVATQEDIVYLRRCGVRYDRGLDSLSMFV